MPPPSLRTRTWNDLELAIAVAQSTSLHQVFLHLNLTVGGSQWLAIRARIQELGLDTAHFTNGVLGPPSRRPGRRRSWTDDDLRTALVGAVSMAEVMRRLGLSPRGGSRDRIKRRIRELGLDDSSLRGQRWARGSKRPRPDLRRPLEEILVADSDHRNTHRLRLRLLEEGLLVAACAICGGTTWRDSPIPLRLDHVNGDRRDNRLENLRLLCGNCDAQTDTYCGRNIGRYDGG